MIRVATHGPTLAWAPTIDVVTDPPPLAEFEGRPVTWADWEIAPEIVHFRQYDWPRCDRCGYDGQQWITFGAVPSAEGEMFGNRPAWPVKRLVAFRCPACAACPVYDMGAGAQDGTGWRVLVDHAGQEALF